MSLWGVDWDGIRADDAAHLAALAWQLPPASRTRSAIEPAAAFGPDVQLLRLLEHELHTWLWAHTKEAKDSATAPDPIWLPGEEERHERMVEEARRQAAKIADFFGFGGGRDAQPLT